MDANREARSPLMGVLPERSQEAKSPRAANGEGRGVGTLAVSASLKSRSAERSAARGCPAVGRLALPLGILTWQDIFPRPAW